MIQGFVALFDQDSGAPVALVDGAVITELRTAAASGLATRELARKDAQSCGILGTGVQAVSHIAAMCAVRSLREIVLWGRDFDKASRLARRQAPVTGLAVRATRDPADAAACDVVCTVTGSASPVLQGDWVRPGAHVNLVGSHTLDTREADTPLLQKSLVYVDSMEAVRNEGGNIMIPIAEGALHERHIVGEIGQLLNGDIAGRTEASAITLYNSLGIAAQDLYAASHVYRRARERDAGARVDF
jgi:ornithine cyclodeaminase